MSFRFPYLSLDVETTGLDRQKSHVLQLAAVFDNGEALDKLPSFNRIIKWPKIAYGEDYAMKMNAHLLESPEGKSLLSVRADFYEFLCQPDLPDRVFVAGKNIGNFDIPVLTNPVNEFDFSSFFYRRFLDPGSMYTEEFTHIPSLDEINKLTGRAEVSHNALDDCFDVIHAIRHKWGVPR